MWAPATHTSREIERDFRRKAAIFGANGAVGRDLATVLAVPMSATCISCAKAKVLLLATHTLFQWFF
jgi:hypothetical protein